MLLLLLLYPCCCYRIGMCMMSYYRCGLMCLAAAPFSGGAETGTSSTRTDLNSVLLVMLLKQLLLLRCCERFVWQVASLAGA